MPAMKFKTNIGAQGQTKVVTLSNLQTELTSLNASKLFERAMIILNQPSPVSIGLTAYFVQAQTAGSPEFRVVVWGNSPKDFNEALAA